MTRHYSNSNFAESIRLKFGFPPKPHSASMGGWNEYETACKTKNKFINWLTNDGIDSVQYAIDLPKNFLHYIEYNFRNFKNQTHVLRTSNGKPGQWYDLPERINDALFTAVIDFVEIECAHMHAMFDEERKKLLKSDKKKYGKRYGYAYLNRYEGEEFDDGTDWTDWIAENNEIKAIYEFAKSYFEFDAFKIAKSQLNYEPTGAVFDMNDETRTYYALVRELESDMYLKVNDHLIRLIKIKDRMWT